jgi:hypothetical protein
MSVVTWLSGFKESCARKKDVRRQFQPNAQRVGPLQPANGAASRPPNGAAPVTWTASAAAVPKPPAPADTVATYENALFSPASASVRCLADIPSDLRDRIQQEGMARAVRRLETPLRALNMATSRKGSAYPPDELRGFLVMWRQALADYLGLVPDERSALIYDRAVDEAYFVRGRCSTGAHLTVVEPCWRLNGDVVIRGEAQVVQGWVR